MPDPLQHALHLILHGLVTELPAQLTGTAVTTPAAAAQRARQRRRVTTSITREQESAPDQGDHS